MPAKHCARCGVEMRRRVRPSGNKEAFSKFKNRKHCSLACRLGVDPSSIRPPEIRPCEICKKPTKNPRYCSKQCFGITLIGSPLTPKQGRDQARRLYARESCTTCGTTENVQIHHVDHNPTNNQRQNIDFLCDTCHRRYHNSLRPNQKVRHFPTP